MLNGFGAEKIGLAALRAPVIATLIVAIFTLVAAAGILRLGYSGANIDMLRDGSQEIADYDELLNSFRNFNNDAIVLLRGSSLDTVEGIETYRDLHFDLQFDEQVESVLSLFSLVRYDVEEGGWQSALPARFGSDEEVKEELATLAGDIPNSRSLFDPQGGSAVLVVYVKQEAVQDATVRDTVDRFKELAGRYASDNLQITIAGQPAIRSDLIVSIVGDMIKLLPLAALLCAAIAWLIFRNFTAVFVCVAAPVCAVIWLLGGMGLAGIDITFLTNILPVLIVVVVFSDSLHLFMKWNRLATGTGDASAALHDSVSQIGPACTLSALTTALALISLVLAGNQGLMELGIVGGIAMLASLAGVLVITPLAIYWAKRAGLNSASEQATRLSRMAGPAIAAFRGCR